MTPAGTKQMESGGWGGGVGGGRGERGRIIFVDVFFFFFFFFTVALLSAGAENFASIVAAREGRRESTVTMETSIPLTHTTDPLRTHSAGGGGNRGVF